MIILLSIILGSSVLTRGHIWGDDFASYVMQAQSILNGTTDEFIEHNSFTIFQSTSQIGPVAYPWGYPLILTPAYALKGNHPLALKLPGVFFYAGFIVSLYLLMKLRLKQTESLLVTGLFAVNPLLLGFLDHIASDIPFLFFSTLTLWLMLRNENGRAEEVIIIGCAAAFAFFIRTTGILLLASFFAWQAIEFWRNRTETSLRKGLRNIALSGITFGALWLLFTLLFPAGGEAYFAQYQGFQIETAIGFVDAYFQVFRQFFGEHAVWEYIYYGLVVFFFIGAWYSRKEDSLFVLLFLFWMIVMTTWPSWQGPRFIFPLLPIFVYFAFQGMKVVLGKLPANYLPTGQWILYGFWSVVAAIFLANASLNAYTNLQADRAINGPYDAFSKEVYQYIKDETPEDSVIVFFKPRAMRLMTDRDTFLSTNCERILEGDYLVLSTKVGENLQIPPERIDSCNLPLNQVLRNNRFIVYEIQK
jgi:4-amino-4-deoxy-L-arabinose transferase-like glycosyltransferase